MSTLDTLMIGCADKLHNIAAMIDVCGRPGNTPLFNELKDIYAKLKKVLTGR